MSSYSIKPDFPPELLYELFILQDNGDLIRKTSRGGKAKGSIAGYIRTDGYTYIRVKNRQYLGHLLNWYYYYREWPKEQLDHLNGITSDNRIENLRDVSQSLNQQNQKQAPITNKSSGLLGVSKNGSKWQARITIPGGTRKSLGGFNTPEEAAEAYKIAKRKYFPDSYIEV